MTSADWAKSLDFALTDFVVEFAKTDLAYQIFQEISLSLSSLSDNRIVTLDFTTDPLVTLTFSSIQN